MTVPIEAVKTTEGFKMILLGCCEDAPDRIIIPPGGANLPGTLLGGGGGVSVGVWLSYTLQPPSGAHHKQAVHHQHFYNELNSI